MNIRKRGFGPSYFLVIIHKALVTISTKRLDTKKNHYHISPTLALDNP